jgi:hypothetical protein
MYQKRNKLAKKHQENNEGKMRTKTMLTFLPGEENKEKGGG